MPKTQYKYKQDYYSYDFNESPYADTSRGVFLSEETYGRKKNKMNKNHLFTLKNIIYTAIAFILLFKVFPYSFNNYIADLFKIHSKTVLKTNYYKLMYPTHSYLYKDLFLGKYILKDTEYKNYKMTDINEIAPRTGLTNSLTALSQEFPEIQPAVYVWEYRGKSYTDINANKIYPAASIIKIPVLIEMLKETDEGRFSLTDTIRMEDYFRADGSGVLKNIPGHTDYSMDRLAEVMIGDSDNSATNMIIAKSGGMPEINRAIKSWGFKVTRINNWLPDLEGTNITTAREIAKMLYNLDTTNIVSRESKQKAGYYLSHVKNNRLLQAGLPEDALLMHKTGDIGYMLGDAGIVRTASGKKYIAVILAKRPYNSPRGKEFIVRASKLIYENIEYR